MGTRILTVRSDINVYGMLISPADMQVCEITWPENFTSASLLQFHWTLDWSLERKTTAHAGLCSRNAANEVLQFPRHLLSNFFHACQWDAPKPKRHFSKVCYSTFDQLIARSRISVKRKCLSSWFSWFSVQENNDSLIFIFKRYASPDPLSHPSQTLFQFLLFSTLPSSSFLPSTTEPCQPLHSRLLRKTNPPHPFYFFAFLFLSLQISFSLPFLWPPLPVPFSVFYLHSLTDPAHNGEPLAFPLPDMAICINPPNFPLMFKPVKLFSSVPLISFAYKHFLKAQEQT